MNDQSVKGQYFVMPRSGRFVVCFEYDGEPWIRTIAHFDDKDRAEDYAETENYLSADFPEDPHRHADVKEKLPGLVLPPSAVGQIAAVLKAEARPLIDAPKEQSKPENEQLHEASSDEIEASEPEIEASPAQVETPALQKKKRRNYTRFPMREMGDPTQVTGLPPGHDAIINKRTLFPDSVKLPGQDGKVLVSGSTNRKLGDRIVKGAWKGLPIYHLNLEERATCPETCFHWTTCYGNGMPQARRNRNSPALIQEIDKELQKLSRDHRKGFAIRLHTLGDFYSTEYVGYWKRALASFQGLHVFGYTAHAPDSEIGQAILELDNKFLERCAIRFSSQTPMPMGATTIFRAPESATVEEGIVCPAETGQTDNCGTCGLCWNENAFQACIVFVAHGPKFDNERPKKKKETRHYPTEGLTENQSAVLEAVADLIDQHGEIPSYSAIVKISGTPLGSINHNLYSLVKKGYLKQTGASQKDVEIVTQPPSEDQKQTDQRSDGKLISDPVRLANRGAATCARPGCKYPAQPGKEICANCSAAELAMKRRKHSTTVEI